MKIGTSPKKISGIQHAHLPGEEFIWVIVFGEILVFTCFFCLFLWYRQGDPELFHQSQWQLNAYYGLSNMLIMLISSWFVATALSGLRNGDLPVARWMSGLGVVCGLLFCALKYAEYQGRFAEGIFPDSNDFFRLYFLLTGIHLVHVIIATAAMLWFCVALIRGGLCSVSIQNFESGATYWHMADFLWIILFPLIYLLP